MDDKAWLSRNLHTVLHWGQTLGLDILTAVASDLGPVAVAAGMCDEYDVTPPGEPVKVDVVVPFWQGDKQYVFEAVRSICRQKNCNPTLHVVADNCDFPDGFLDAARSLPDRIDIRCFRTSENVGPYRIVNTVAHDFETEFFAMQDADDVSLPDRLWTQAEVLRMTESDAISSAMEHFLAGDDATQRDYAWKLRAEPILRPGRVYEAVPQGSCVNSTRMVRTEVFRYFNGYPPYECTGDFGFDNVLLMSDPRAKVVFDMRVLARRRVHAGSLSHGVLPMESPRRKRAVSQVMKMAASLKADPSHDNARSFGGYNQTVDLRRVL